MSKSKNTSSPGRGGSRAGTARGQAAAPARPDVAGCIAQSIQLYRQGQVAAALDLVTKGLALDPDNADLLNQRGVFSARLGNAAAEAAYRRAIEVAPERAETHYNLGNLLKAQRRPHEAELAYRQAVAIRPDYAEAFCNLGNLLQEQERGEEAEAAYRAAIAVKPDFPDTWCNLGNLLQTQRRPDEAESAYRRAVAIRPDYAEAHSNLGVLLKAQKRPQEAEAAHRRALAARPDFAEAWSNLGVLLLELKRLDESEVAYRRAIEARPDYADPWVNLGNLLQVRRRTADAESAYRRALALNPRSADARWNLSVLLLKTGRFGEGWPQYEARYDPGRKNRKASPPPTLRDGPPLPPQWQGEPLTERSLLVWPEQGLGDEIQFLRYLPLFRARGLKHLTLACKPPLKKLFAAQGFADRVLGSDDWRPEMAAEFDYWCYLLSLPLHFATTLDIIPARIPYLTAAPEGIACWAPRLPNAARRVGLVWKGSPSHANDTNRSLPSLGTLAPLWSLPEIAFISLQKGAGEDEACAPPDGQPLTHLGAGIADFADSAAIVSQLDLVICIDTAMAHLAGALGKPCWVLLPDYDTDWRWLEERTDSPWYPDVMRLFRQDVDGDWDGVVRRVVDALKAWMSDAALLAASPSSVELAQGDTSPGKSGEQMNPDVLLPSAFMNEDGKARFEMPIPGKFMKDPGAAFLVKHETEYGGYEYPTRKFLDEHVKPGDVFIDVGAHWGIFTLTAATRWPGQVSVWALEPHPENLEVLRRAIAHNHLGDGVTVWPVAAGASAGTLSLGLNSSMGHSLVQNRGPSIEVAVERLDSLLGKLPPSGRIFLKIDAEGFEPEVLSGARNLVADPRLVAIIWEKGRYFDAEPGLSGLRNSLELLRAAGFSQMRFPDENAGGSLIEFKLNNERCNIFSLRDLASLPCYEKPPGKNAPPVPAGPVALPVTDNPSVAAAAQRPTPEIMRRHEAIARKQTDRVRWSDPGQLDPAWNQRAMFAAQFIPCGARVLDIGCGAMALEKLLPAGCTYMPCDVVARDSRTLVCDLNVEPLPEFALATVDVAVALGVLEYLMEPESLLRVLAKANKALVTSYCLREWTSHLDRRSLGWVNSFSLQDLLNIFKQAGYSVRRAERADGLQMLFRLEPEVVVAPKVKKGLVLSYGNVGNFGDRLGYHVLNGLLPPHAEVSHAYFKPWAIPEDDYDFLVLGIGNSLFAPLLTDELMALLDRIPRKIGIFGTQYRTELPAARLAAVVDRLDHWYARYEEDVLIYGRGRGNVSHLGDWLVHAFPMAHGRNENILRIGDEVWKDLPLDRTIQRIQQYRRVYSSRLHPLLCALTSAEQVAFKEQRESGNAVPSGKFRSLLIDVFGRDFPEEQFWKVDRDAVHAYKAKVARNLSELQARLYSV